jgi:hypothetical protein
LLVAVMRIAGPVKQLRGNPHFLNSVLAFGLLVGPVCVYYFAARQTDEEKERVGVSWGGRR